jgi:hypothetical protein
VGSYRDDRAALRQQIDELERELAQTRTEANRDQIAHELAALDGKLRDARAKLDADRSALDELGDGLSRLRKAAAVDPAPEASPEASPAMPRPALWLTLCAIAVLAAIVFVLTRSAPVTGEGQSFVGIPGAPHAVDPIGVLGIAEQKAGRHDHLVSIEAEYVRSDGTVDLKARTHPGRITYTFGTAPGPAPSADPSRPLGAASPGRDMPVESSVVISSGGIERRPVMFGMRSRAVRKPRCPTGQVWQAAIAAGAPSAAVAKLKYAAPLIRFKDSDPAALWTFAIQGTAFTFAIDDDTCAVHPSR